MKMILPFLLLAILTACALPSLTGLAPAGTVLFLDTFDDPSSGWSTAASSDGQMGYSQGAYTIQVARPDFDLWSVSGQTYRDGKVEADVVKLEGPDVNRAGLICRYRSPQEYYFFVISGDGYYALGKVKAGSRSLLGQDEMAFSNAIATSTGANHLRLDCVGDSLTGYVNGQLLASATDNDYRRGDGGVLAGAFDLPNVRFAFDNFVVYQP